MKTIKRLFYGISLCIFLICVAILAFTTNPQWSERLSQMLYGDRKQVEEETPTPVPSESPGTDAEDVVEPQNTPIVYITPTPVPEQKPDIEVGEVLPEEPEYKPKTIDIKTVVPTKLTVNTYQVPISETIKVPETINGLYGYAEITATLTEVEKAEVTQLENELSEGDTGALLVFDQKFYPYYHMLNDSEKELYRQVFANAYALTEKFKPCVEIFSTNVGRVVEAVFNDNPVLYMVENSYGCKYGPDGKVVEISLQFNDAAKKPEQSRQKFDERAEEILSVARTFNSDYDKEKYVHDRLAGQIVYAEDAPMNQSAYSAMVNGKTVCAGYARAFQYLMQQLGIPCYYCRGYSGENHAWNIVELYGDYYNVDLTWDDAIPGNYDYFNKTDADLASTHIRRGASIKLPACNGTLYGNLEVDNKENASNNDSIGYSSGLELYYDNLCKRIEGLGYGDATYSDIVDVNVWKELEEAYVNGNNSFREEYLVRALHKAGAQYCIISLSAKEVTDNAYEVECALVVR